MAKSSQGCISACDSSYQHNMSCEVDINNEVDGLLKSKAKTSSSSRFVNNSGTSRFLIICSLITLVVISFGLLFSLLWGNLRPTMVPNQEPNPPTWPDSIRIFHPSDSPDTILQSIVSLTSQLTNRTTGHFSTDRYAFLFNPGVYNVTFEVGYYVQVLGLGRHAMDVQFLGGPRCGVIDRRIPGAGSLDTFWRSIENVRISTKTMVWAVSQAAPFRRLQIDGNLDLFEGYCVEDTGTEHLNCGAYYASGGFMANVNVDGYVNFGSQQQYLSRNINFNGGSGGGAWNLVFVGCNGDHLEKKNSWDGSDLVRTNDEVSRVRVEKPYIIAEEQRYKLVVPKAFHANKNGRTVLVGANLDTNAVDDVRDFSRVRLAKPGDSYESLQWALDNGLDLVFSPGIYRLGRTLYVTHPGTVVLGLGLATLVAPGDGSPVLHVAPKVPDVRVAGFIFEANVIRRKSAYKDKNGIKYKHSTLLIWGAPGVDDPGNELRPGVLSDFFCRIGGTTFDRNASVEIMVQLFSGNILGDHLWLWRPDHLGLKLGEQPTNAGKSEYYLVQKGECPSMTGLQVMGDDVTMIGLSVEHFTKDMVLWRGDRGQVRFFQSELPYDVSQRDYGDRAYVSYLVDEYVVSHDLAGAGVYSYFRDDNVTVDMAFRHSGGAGTSNPGVNMTNIFTRFLNGLGSIRSVVNMEGDAVSEQSKMSRVEFSG